MYKIDEIHNICKNVNIDCFKIGDLIETSPNDEDRRYKYNINNEYFLKISNNKTISESFLGDIERLIKRYRSIGVYCPNLYRTIQGNLSYSFKKDDMKYTCYVEDLSSYPLYESYNTIDYNFKKSVLKHLGILASKYTNVDLSEIKSMWSLIELGPLDKDVDERQENMDILIKTLLDKGYDDIATKLFILNIESRNRIRKNSHKLSRCVYQGELNSSNILVDEDNNFSGLIDFNMFGTEVNINCFLNESMYFIRKQDFEEMSAQNHTYYYRHCGRKINAR